jgi:hypothetical protein
MEQATELQNRFSSFHGFAVILLDGIKLWVIHSLSLISETHVGINQNTGVI